MIAGNLTFEFYVFAFSKKSFLNHFITHFQFAGKH